MENKKVTIVTHSSKFHSDDIFAVATLELLLEKDHEITVVRSRDKEIINAADYVVDVGGEYDPSRNRFDHHQEGRAGERENGIPYASFGLVWKTYGEKVCGSKEVADVLDTKLAQPIDAHDNGVILSVNTKEGVEAYGIEEFFKAFVPSWKEGLDHVDDVFMECVKYAKILLSREILKSRDALEARDIVRQIYTKTEDKRLIVFNVYCGASNFITEYPEPLFIIFPSSDGTWILETVQDDLFINRKSLPEAWAGKSGEELEEITGVPGSIFCHTNRFLAVAKTKEAILKLGELALKNPTV